MRLEYLPFGKPNFSDEEVDAVSRVMRSGWIGMGPETIAFERELADYLNMQHVVTVNSCTSALFLALQVCGIKEGDEVICPSLTWCSTANAALYLNAKPVFCDIDTETLCINVEDLLLRVTSKTKAIVVVHYGGLAIDVAYLRARLPEHIAIIEDAAHAFGSRYPDGQLVGTSGNLTCFSFYANKNLSTGEGGAIVTSDNAMTEKLQSLRQHALPIDAWKRFTHPKSILMSNQLTELGYKMNYTDLQASIGRVQLARFDSMQQTRQQIAEFYFDGLQNIGISFQRSCTNASHAKHLFVIRLPLAEMRYDRDEMVLALRARNIGASIHYAPLHLMPLYHQGAKPESLPATENLSKTIMTLPISASMNQDDASYVTDTIKELMEKQL
ncbi:MAG: DegT/DnrJ/EryC1/StrS family aminotransferase [Gallionellaceae bacterium]|nr:DegT/DnrJ/EryC1/StrS family aminotransferase [Gallionellaceae bacterium]